MLGTATSINLLFIVVVAVSFAAALWALIDAAIRPGPAFKAAGQNKVLWIILPLAGIILFTIVGGILGAVYLVVIRPKVRLAQEHGPYPEL